MRLLRPALVAAAAVAVLVSATGAGSPASGTAPSSPQVAVRPVGHVGVTPPADAAGENGHAGSRARQNAVERARLAAERDRTAAGEESPDTGSHVGRRADTEAINRAAAERVERAQEKRANALRAEQARAERSTREVDPGVASAVGRTR